MDSDVDNGAVATSPEDLPPPRALPSSARSSRLGQTGQKPSWGWQRTGWFLGAGLGLGSVGYERAPFAADGAAFCFDVYFGGMLTRQLALSAELWSDGHRTGPSSAMAQDVLGVAVRYWFTSNLWIKGGFGAATLVGDDIRWINGSEALEGVSFLLAAGYELLSRDSMALDLSLRALSTGYDTSRWDSIGRTLLAAHLAFTWY